MKKASIHPRKSLRNLFVLWLLGFSVVPLAFVTGYSLVKFEAAINQELMQRLRGNRREFEIVVRDLERELTSRNRQHAQDKNLVYMMTSNRINEARSYVQKWLTAGNTRQLRIFNSEGRLEIFLYKNAEDEIERQSNLEQSAYYLSNDFLNKVRDGRQMLLVDFSTDKTADFVVFSPVRSTNGVHVGYVEEVFPMDERFFTGLKKRLSLEVALVSYDGEKIVASRDDLTRYKENIFLEEYKKEPGGLFELNIQGVPFGFSVQPLKWGDENFYLAVGASKELSQQVLKNINMTFFVVVGVLVILLILLSLFISRMLLKPLNDLVDAVKVVHPEARPTPLPVTSDTEIGLLTENFNQMQERVYRANQEIKETQAKLVHTAKMASLGQLVAGIAHELNNPIGFIYSNMNHLRDYSERLIRLVRVAGSSPGELEAKKTDLEFDFVEQDLPKLIKSCEEGARRTRDIVVGLRNFSRLDEAKLKEVDIHEGIEGTLQLLAGELQSRIKVHRDFGDLPKVHCYASQLNQVFMNILSNAIQAIEGDGDIFIKTRRKGDEAITISIRDTGHGMAADVREKIFDPFFTTKDVSHGTGLGMSITFGVVQKHGGEIEVVSAPQKGTEFIVTLPLRAAETQLSV